jgi:hypothetical protein
MIDTILHALAFMLTGAVLGGGVVIVAMYIFFRATGRIDPFRGPETMTPDDDK